MNNQQNESDFEDYDTTLSDLHPTIFDQIWWSLNSFSVLLFFFVLVISLAIAVYLFRPYLQPSLKLLSSQSSAVNSGIPAYSIDNFNNRIFYADRPPNEQHTDIFSKQIAPHSTPVNLTNSLDRNEFMPSPSPSSNAFAFFSIINEGRIDLYVSTKNQGLINIVYRTGNTRLGNECQISTSMPPTWSPDAKWIIFIGECSNNVTDLFVANSNGDLVKELTHSRGSVLSADWIDAENIVYGEQENGTGIMYQISIVDLEPKAISTFSIFGAP